MADTHVAEFRLWVDDNKRTGFDGNRKECYYLPPTLLRQYWNVDRVKQVLSDCGLEDDAAEITKRFLRIFSTLVHLGQIQRLTLFTDFDQDDITLPMRELTQTTKNLLKEFWDEQWMFCPLEFSKPLIFKRKLHTRHILPVTYGPSLRSPSWAGDGPSIEQVEIHNESSIDVWALGAIYSDVLVWSLTEEPGREEYCEARKKAIQKLKHITERGFEACFHDGTEVLGAVKEHHAAVLEYKRGPDRISPGISEFILKEMLRVAKSRTTADTLMSRAEELMQDLESEADGESSQDPPTCDPGPMSRVGKDGMNNKDERRSSHPRPMTPQTNRSIPTPKSPTVITYTNSAVTNDGAIDQPVARRPAIGEAPVEKMYEILEKKRSKNRSIGRALDMFQGKHFDGSIETPEMVSARRGIEVNGGRDQIFLVDNFDSMRQWTEQTAVTARVISYVTKVADNDGMDLIFASDSTKSRNYSKSKQVESAIRKMKFARGRCNMKNCLLNIVKEIFKDGKKNIKPTSIYVYTGGDWDDANEVKTVIKKSINHLAKAEEDPSTLMFQFIRFGEDENGIECLRQLDDECKEQRELGE
ncbi:hypothetical protein Neosp_012395 [[Neocosmospora] mangrovei]